MIAILSLLVCLITIDYSLTVTKDTLPWLGALDCDECHRVYVPVCGYDNKTYINECKLYCANKMKERQDRYYFKYYGTCTLIRRSDNHNYLIVQPEGSTAPELMIEGSLISENFTKFVPDDYIAFRRLMKSNNGGRH